VEINYCGGLRRSSHICASSAFCHGHDYPCDSMNLNLLFGRYLRKSLLKPVFHSDFPHPQYFNVSTLIVMTMSFLSFFTTLFFLVLVVNASPIGLIARAALDVYVPKIITPNSDTFWTAGQTGEVTWYAFLLLPTSHGR